MVTPSTPHCPTHRSHWSQWLAESRSVQLIALTITVLLLVGALWESVRSRSATVGLKLQLLSHDSSKAELRPRPEAHAAASSEKAGPVHQLLSAFCTAETFSKQSCLFSNVCLQPGAKQLAVLLPAQSQLKDRVLLERHLNNTLQGIFNISISDTINSSSSSSTAFNNGNSTIWDDHTVTMLWRPNGRNQQSFGHALVNEAFPAFMVLQNHLGQDIPPRLQLLVTSLWHTVLQHVFMGTISNNTLLLHERLQQLQRINATTLCFPRLLLGDGGYIAASRASIANSGQPESVTYSSRPTFFSSSNWWSFRQHTLQASGVVQATPPARPLILLNDKRHGPNATADRRMIMDVDKLAADIQAAYPAAEVVAARLRDMQWSEQLQLLSSTRVFITTQGSSAFRLIFLPRGSTCIMLGAPENPGTVWKSFHELDRWFPLGYVRFERYVVSVHNKSEYKVNVIPDHWQPTDPQGAKDWWLYNADVAVDMCRLRPLLDRALGPTPFV